MNVTKRKYALITTEMAIHRLLVCSLKALREKKTESQKTKKNKTMFRTVIKIPSVHFEFDRI